MSLYLEPKTMEFDVFKCPELGIVSPKACTVCRIQTAGKCKLKPLETNNLFQQQTVCHSNGADTYGQETTRQVSKLEERG